MINDTLKLRGDLQIVLKDKDGKVKESRTEKNLIVSAGLTFICDRMADASSSVMSHMAVGSGTTTPAAGNTDLVSILLFTCLRLKQARELERLQRPGCSTAPL